MKKKSFFICLSLSAVVVLCSCSINKQLKPNTPVNTGILLGHSLRENNYEAFNNLLSQGGKNTISKDDFKNLTKVVDGTSGTSYVLYETLTLDNGEILLVRLTAEKVDGKYGIEDVTLISEEMK